MHAYCLFCETKRCKEIAAAVEEKYGHRSFSPQIVQRKWVKGVPFDERHDWLPGYIFIYTKEPVTPRFAVKGILRCLGNDELRGNDLKFAEMLYLRNGVFGDIALAEVGDRCRVADPAWESLSGTVVKLDRSRKRCCVEFDFDGIRRKVWVGYEIVKPEKHLQQR